jgi:pimeloyl-ACP methyl ester carboxylesterase
MASRVYWFIPPAWRIVLRAERKIMSLRRLSSCCLVVLLCWFAHGPAAAAPHGRTHVYLLRGIFNVSVGLDALAGTLARMGIAASVYGHGESGAVASEAIRDYKNGRVRSIILIGHSLGGGAVLDVAEQLKNAGVPVALLISLESGSSGPVASNVRRAVNFYISGSGVPVRPGPGFRGSLRNIDVARIRGMDHMTIQSMPSMHSRMLGYMGGAHAGRAAASASEAIPAITVEATGRTH